MNWELFRAFLVIPAVLVVTRGPIETRFIPPGAREGARAAVTSVAGTTLGNAVLLAAIALGLSWVVRNAATLFEILRWVGAAYLLWLGIQAWRRAGEDGAADLPRGQCMSGVASPLRYRTRRRSRFSRRSCRSSSIPPCRSNVSSR